MTEKSKNNAKRDLENLFHAEDFDYVCNHGKDCDYETDCLARQASAILRNYVKQNGKRVYKCGASIVGWTERKIPEDTHTAILLDEKEIKNGPCIIRRPRIICGTI